MTETEWLASDDPQAMLREVTTFASERKLRLFACACALAEYGRLDEGYRDWEFGEPNDTDPKTGESISPVNVATSWCVWHTPEKLSQAKRAAILRDIFGNPFRPVPAWKRCVLRNSGFRQLRFRTW